ncbi:uncharacterized protein LOC132066188 [Lycium ferocissimum]|uniref:uncharacterized protein LOC132066188 n=1 Tax=Lycium ferocissimum TaxID=112874 RepID=UPI0028163348|nr:uncharacterized protein LOC132066188 [Lycium ferocissimum]
MEVQGTVIGEIPRPTNCPSAKEKLASWNNLINDSVEGNSPSWAAEVENAEATSGNVLEPESVTCSVTKRSVWDNFDIAKITNTGLKLEYVPPTNKGDQLIVEIKDKDISSEVEYWKNSVVCYVLSAHPPFSVLNGFIQRLWGKLGINKIVMMKNGIVLVRFDAEDRKQEVIQGGIYHFDSKPFIVKAWNPDMEFSREELFSVPIWVKLPGLDFKYWSAKGLGKIGSLIRKPLMVDKSTEKKIGLKLLVEVRIGAALPTTVSFLNEKGNLIEQRVIYDWQPTICKVCKKYGHAEDTYRKNKVNKPVERQEEWGKQDERINEVPDTGER